MAEATVEAPKTSAIDNRKVNRAAFEEIADRLEGGEELTFEMVGDIFGKHFWIILVYTMLDATTAARSIDGAIRRLSELYVRPNQKIKVKK